MKWTCKW